MTDPFTNPLTFESGQRPVIYVAGPFRAKPAHDRWNHAVNVRNAEEWAFFLANEGAIPLCVHTMFQHFDGTLTDQFWLDATLDLLKRCDGALFIPGWEKSTGSLVEHSYCEARGVPTFDLQSGSSDRFGKSIIQFRPWLAKVAEKFRPVKASDITYSGGPHEEAT